MLPSRQVREGGTIFHGRGTSTDEWMIFLGVLVEPEKEVVLTVVPRDISREVLISISKAAELEKTGNGISVVWPLSMAVGRVEKIPTADGRDALERQEEVRNMTGPNRDPSEK